MNDAVLCLCGGVGGAKLAHGLSRIVAPGDLRIVVNTGDDFQHLGLHISPDLDTVLYTLAGAADPERGWGRAAETWRFMEALTAAGAPAWFQLGDKDLAVHLYRTWALEQGMSLAQATRELGRSFGIEHRLLPMSDDPVRTRVLTDQGELAFQDYFVRLACRPRVKSIAFAGAGRARANPEFAALAAGGADAVILCPSNPFLSLAPILALPNVRSALCAARAPVVAVSPVVGGKALKGPTARIMKELGMAAGNPAIARCYGDFLDGLIIDESDEDERAAVERLGMAVTTANIVMNSLQDRIDLAQLSLRFAASLRP